MAFLEINHISKTFSGKKILNDISISVQKGSFFSLLGPSGCGKTTLLRIIAGIEQTEEGQIILDGKDITQLPPQKRNCGIVFQNYALFPHMTVFENVAYGLKIKKTDSAHIKNKVADILGKVGLAEKIHQSVSLLSGGEQQRVSLARVIVTEPELILFDEPLSNLDHSMRIEARNELKRLQNDLGITSVYVTHDQTEALALSDDIAVMNKGVVVQTGNPKDIYFNPTNLFSADFVGHYNCFNPQLAQTLFNQSIQANQVLAILPEHLQIHKSGNGTPIKVKDVLFTGSFIEYVLNYEEKTIKVISPFQLGDALKMGDQVSLSAIPGSFKTLS